jgi:hypothetical protein
MPFAHKPKTKLRRGRRITPEVEAARAHMRATGWSYRAAALRLGGSWQHLAQVLTGQRESRRLVRRVLALPARDRAA